MNNPNETARFVGLDDTGPYGVPPLVSRALPDDFPKRLERLKEASGLSWRGMARAIGVDHKLLLRWRKGAVPSGGSMHLLYLFAARVDGGLEILIGEGFQVSFFREDS